MKSAPPPRRGCAVAWGSALGALLLVCAGVGAARADGAADGEAGLKALDRGAYDEAIRLFTRAIGDGDLAGDDLEFAYLDRGKAYLGKGDDKAALADLGKAVSLKPDDADARAALRRALGQGSSAAAGEGAQAALPLAVAARWGLLASMAGRYYWYQVPGKDPKAAYLHLEWTMPGRVLGEAVRAKSGPLMIGQLQLDGATGKLLSSVIVSRRARYGTVDAATNAVTDFTYIDGKPVRDSMTRSNDGTVSEVVQQYLNGSWQAYEHLTLVETSEDELEAQGLVKKR